jgi:hypothetical protein
VGGISWVASYPKSGNTWLRLFLASYHNGGNPIHPNALPREFEAGDHAEEHYYAAAACDLNKLNRTDVLHLRGAVLIQIMTEARLRPLWVKTHHARVVLDDVRLIPEVYTSKSVYIVRDPRDVAISFAHWSKTGVDDSIRWMNAGMAMMRNRNTQSIFHFLGTWSSHVDSWGCHADTLTIRYEDMHEKPEETFSKVLEHVGIEVDAERVKQAVENVAFDRLHKFEDTEKFHEAPPTIDRFFRVGKAGQWRDILTDEQTEQIETDHGHTMKRMGYLDE